MTINEKQKIATIARNLLQGLERCDDERFINLIIEYISNADPYSICLEKQ